MKINILYLIWSLEVGGAERIVISLAKYLDKEKYNPIICCLNYKGKLSDEVEKLGIKLIELHKKPKIDLSVIPKLIRVIKENNIHIVHTHLWTADFWGRIAAKLARVPIIVSTMHNVDSWKPWYFFLADKFLSGFTDEIIAVSEKVRDFYINKVGLDSKKVVTIYNGVELDRLISSVGAKEQKLKEFGFEVNDKVIGIIGRLVEQKGHLFFLQMIKILKNKYPNIKGLIIGEGLLRKKLESVVREKGLEKNIVFAGLRKDIPELLNCIDVLVSSSVYEGLPMIILEAMAAGKPIVATTVGGNPEIIDDSKTGFLVSSHNPGALAQKVEVLLNDQELSRKMGECAQEKIKQLYSIETMVLKTEGIYEKLLSLKIVSQPKAKVALIIDDLRVGGAQKQFIELVNNIDQKKFDIFVVSLSTEIIDLLPELKRHNVEIALLNQKGKFCIPTLIKLFKLFRKNKPTIVHTFLFTASFYGRIAAKLSGVPLVIVSERSTDVWKKMTYTLADSVLAKITNKILVNAEAIKEMLLKRERIPTKKIQVVYNGVDSSRFNNGSTIETERIKKDLNILNGNQIIGIVGRLAKEKDHLTFLKAAKQIVSFTPNINFLVVGNGALKAELEEASEELRIRDKVIFIGNSQNIPEMLSAMDILASTSLYEGCSNVILEAMAAGVPVVATAVGGNPEIVVDGQTGILVPPQNPDILAEVMLLLLSNPRLGKQMGERSRQRIKERFLLTHMVEATQKVYEELIGSKKCCA